MHLFAFSWYNIGATAAIRDDGGGLLEADDETQRDNELVPGLLDS